MDIYLGVVKPKEESKMTYNEAIDYIMSRRKFQKSSSHERIEKLLELLGSPEKELKFVHIVGTNGKGSVSTALSYILRKAGYTTGLFTSPYIVEFGERIQVNGEYISHEDIASLTATIKEKTDLMEKAELYPTVFEVTTALAFLYFAKRNCDIVCLEAGIGGEHDSTNVIPESLVSVFAGISLDHTQMLGGTVREIAKEKSGIIKVGSKVVSYPDKGEELGFSVQKDEALSVIKYKCKEMGCRLYVPNVLDLKVIKSDITGSTFIYDGINYHTRLCGAHQIANMITVITAANCLRDKGFEITNEDMVSGINEFNIPGRMEVVAHSPVVILDGGHNEGCMIALNALIKRHLKGKKITLLAAFMKDKDYAASLRVIAPLCENIVFTRTDEVRGESPEGLAEAAKGLGANIFCEDDCIKAYQKAMSLTKKEDAMIVAGSFYLVSEIRNGFYK